MKKIALFMPYGSVGGMERVAYSFYQYYKKKNYKVIGIKIIGEESDIINFGDDEIIISKKDFSAYSKFERLKFYLSIPGKLADIIKSEKIDYTISFGDMANCFSALTRTKEKKIASIHAVKSIEMANNSLMDRFFKLSYKTIYKRLWKVVAISNAIKEDLLANFNYKFDNLDVIYNPHDIESIALLSKEPLENDFEQDLFDDNNVILFLGRLTIQKSPWHLINAYAISKFKDQTKLVFIGDGNQDVIDFLEKQIKELGLEDRIHFLGRKNNPYKYLVRAKVLAMSSLYEGTPNVIVEAIALDTPIITSNCTDGIKEMMIFEQNEEIRGLVITDSGVISPSFNTEKIEIPQDYILNIEEEQYQKGLDYLQDNYLEITGMLKDNKDELLKKFRIEKTAESYIN
ncbi:glycosyltransferase [Chryseobacterium sp. FH1]|uniref:glycosyltransferase n=1 Tax=Chryseobacterium sp. FH1 TaxID=1233951 RepID=UPI0004E448D8|nr:glycosyltransferase [Chryseobacterium sp. FH1]KFC24581.1 hypothetical protein IO90_00235 [Chryseobacterium sp. FH1]